MHLLGVLCDVCVVHPIRGTYPHDPVARAATEEGAAASDAEKEKYTKYGALAARRDFGFEPLCVESYGRLGHAFIAFLHEVATHVTKGSMPEDNIPVDGHDRGAAFKVQVGRVLRGYKRLISLVRVREFARRVKSAYFGRARARNVPLASAVEVVRGGGRAGVQVGAGDGAGDEVGVGAGNEGGERGGSERIMEGVNRHGNEESDRLFHSE